MGSGVAKVLFERYPSIRVNYLAWYAAAQKNKEPFLGEIAYNPNHPHHVINAITQRGYGYDGKLYADYEAIESCFKKLNAEAERRNAAPNALYGVMHAVAMPLIGCGLAGGSWPVVSEIIERTSLNYQPVVYALDGIVPEG